MRITLCSFVLLAACGSGEPPAWGPAPAELTPVQQAQLTAATAAKDALAKTLVGELTAAMQEGGPVLAITVCQQRAPQLAADVGALQGVRIGRTSTKLRNPGNQPPEWAAAHVASDSDAAASFTGPLGELGALFPIRLMPQCIACHGKPEVLGPDVKGALAMRYPADQATGFVAGDLRGWFWVEVPKNE